MVRKTAVLVLCRVRLLTRLVCYRWYEEHERTNSLKTIVSVNLSNFFTSSFPSTLNSWGQIPSVRLYSDLPVNPKLLNHVQIEKQSILQTTARFSRKILGRLTLALFSLIRATTRRKPPSEPKIAESYPI